MKNEDDRPMLSLPDIFKRKKKTGNTAQEEGTGKTGTPEQKAGGEKTDTQPEKTDPKNPKISQRVNNAVGCRHKYSDAACAVWRIFVKREVIVTGKPVRKWQSRRGWAPRPKNQLYRS